MGSFPPEFQPCMRCRYLVGVVRFHFVDAFQTSDKCLILKYRFFDSYTVVIQLSYAAITGTIFNDVISLILFVITVGGGGVLTASKFTSDIGMVLYGPWNHWSWVLQLRHQ